MHPKLNFWIVPLMAAMIGIGFAPRARSQELPELLLGTQTNSVSWFPLYVAMKKGLFREYGFTFKPVILSNQAAVPALVQKEIPYITNLGRVMSGAGRGLPIRERPAEVRNVISGVLKGIAYTRTRRDEVLPLLQEFIKLESVEMTRRAYEAIKDIWPENGLPTDEGLKNVLLSEEIPIDTPVAKMTNWGPLNEAVTAAKRH